MILTSIGEQGVSVGDRTVKFRPSFLAMSRIGTPKEIVATFTDICGMPRLTGKPFLDDPLVKRWRSARFRAACYVMWCCTCEEDEDISWLVGYINERGRYVAGALPLSDIVGLASGLMRHGVTGDPPKDLLRKAKKSDYSNEFDPRGFVAAAMAHLGTSERDAWQMTMTSYVSAMHAKFPVPKDAKEAASPEHFDHVKSWLERVNAARQQQKAPQNG